MEYSLAMDFVVSLTPGCASDPLAALADPPRGASMVELRLDLFPGLDPAHAVAGCPLPVLATYRSTVEGGQGSVDPVERQRAVAGAYDAGAALLDLELDRDLALIGALGLERERVVVSWHDPEGTPGDLVERARRMAAVPSAFAKIVTFARSLGDLEMVLSLLASLRSQPPGRRRLTAFAMGPIGMASRLLAPLMGAPIGYTAWSEAAPAAPGQLAIGRMQRILGHLSGPPRRLFAVVGADVTSSLSPELHSAGLAAEGLPDLMVPVSVPDAAELGELFTFAGTTLFDRVGLPLVGLAVTAPYKEQAADAATVRAPRVERACAANTLLLHATRIVAENTDADGVIGGLTTLGIDPAGALAVICGTGGAARGAAVGLDLAGAEVLLCGREPERSRDWAERLGVGWCAWDDLPGHAAILVNATPLGRLADDPSPFAEDVVTRASAVVEMVYGERPTALEQQARSAGIPVLDGRTMLAHQGMAQFAAFHQRVPPREAMLGAVGPRNTACGDQNPGPKAQPSESSSRHPPR